MVDPGLSSIFRKMGIVIKHNLMVGTGVLVLALGLYGIWASNQVQASPFDIVDTSPVELDDDGSFIPLIQPQGLSGNKMAPEIDFGDETLNRAEKIRIEKDSVSASHPGYVPDRLVIANIHLDAPIVPIQTKEIDYKNQVYDQWLVPVNGMAGWHDTSALIGTKGNVVLNGHHNAYGKVFKDLAKLYPGDIIQVYSGDIILEYVVGTKMLLPERNQSLDVRLENARWVLPSNDERLTLITCWPADGNTHRVIVVAFPREQSAIVHVGDTNDEAITAAPLPAPTSTPFKGLSLSAACSPDKDNHHWQVENTNAYTVNFEYVVDSGYSGVGRVLPGITAEIRTPASEGKILLLYSNGVLQASRSARTRCDG